MRLERKFRAGRFALSLVLMLIMCAGAAFADDETEDTGASISAAVTAGEHGSVNGNTGAFSQTLQKGESLKLECTADEGYVIGSVLVNEAELSAGDLNGIAGSASGIFTLDALEEDVSVTVYFSAADGNTAEGETGAGDPADYDMDKDAVDVVADDEPVEATGDSEASDTSGNDESPLEDSEPADNMDDTDEDSSEEEETGVVYEKDDDDGSGTTEYAAIHDSTPKTGDAFPVPVLIAAILSLTAIGVLVTWHFVKRGQDVEA